MAGAGAHLPLWDRNNTEQEGLIYGTQWDELLIQATIHLKEHLKLDDVWDHLQAFGVLRLTDVERIQLPSRSRPDMVAELIKFIRTGGAQWQYHALFRAVALTGQLHLVPGQDPSVYGLGMEEHSVSQTRHISATEPSLINPEIEEHSPKKAHSTSATDPSLINPERQEHSASQAHRTSVTKPSIYGLEKDQASVSKPDASQTLTENVDFKGDIGLAIEGKLHVPPSVMPPDEYILQLTRVGVTEEQSQALYKLCMHALLIDVREFPEGLLEEFNIAQPYRLLMTKSDRRNITGDLDSYYSFRHQKVIEFLSLRYILGLNNEERISLLLAICSDREMRNIQKTLFKLLAQESNTEFKLLQTMIRSMLILQFGKSKWTVSKTLYDLMHLQDKIKSDIPVQNLLHCEGGKVRMMKHIHDKINKVFETNADILRSARWFKRLNNNDNGTIQHVVACVHTCSPDVQEEIIHNTIHCMLPCTKHDEKTGMIVSWKPAGGARWARVQTVEETMELKVEAWCPGDAADALGQYAATRSGRSDKKIQNLCVNMNQYGEMWGQPGAARSTQEQWDRLVQLLLPLEWQGLMGVSLHGTAQVTGLLSGLSHHAAHLSREKIVVEGGTAELEDLMTCAAKCTQAWLTLLLWKTHIVIPERLGVLGQANSTPVQADVLQGTVVWTTRPGHDEEEFSLSVHEAAPLAGLLPWLLNHVVHLTQCKEIRVEGGTADLEDLVTCLSPCTKTGLKVSLRRTHIVVPERLAVQKDKLLHLKDSLTSVLKDWKDEFFKTETSKEQFWVTETGREYVWLNEADNSNKLGVVVGSRIGQNLKYD